jgi:hypothetical protein
MTKEEIHNIYLHMSGKAEGIAEATGAADFPVLFANAILEYTKREWVGLTDKEQRELHKKYEMDGWGLFYDAIEAKLKEKNHD